MAFIVPEQQPLTLQFAEALLRETLSANNDSRKAAEATLASFGTVSQRASLLLGVARASSASELRQLACVLLRRQLVKEDAPLWPQLDAASRAGLCAEMLSALPAEVDRKVRLSLCELVAYTASNALEDDGGGWPALWPFMQQCVSAPNPALQEAALTIFERLGPMIAEMMESSFASFRDVFLSRLRDAAAPLDVRVAAARAAVSLLTSCAASQREIFSAVLPEVLSLLNGVAAAPKDEAAVQAARTLAGLLVDAATDAGRLFRTCAGDFLKTLTALASEKSADGEARRSAAEALVALAENAGPLCRKTPGYVAGVLRALIALMLEWGDVLEEGWEAEWESGDFVQEDNDDSDAGCHVGFAAESLTRFAAAVGARVALPPLQPLIAELLARPEWTARFAALEALTATAEILDDGEEMLEGVARAAGAAAADVHPRVRAASLDVIGSLCAFQGPAFQMFGHAHAAPALVRGLSDTSRRVRCNAAYAVTMWVENLRDEADADYVVPYAGAFMTGLLGCLGGRDAQLVSQALTAVSALASCDAARETLVAGGAYNLLRPLLLQLLGAADADLASMVASSPGLPDVTGLARVAAAAKAGRTLKGKAIECFSSLGVAMGAEAFTADARSLLGAILGLLAATRDAVAAAAAANAPPADDPVPSYCWDALGRIAAVIGADAFAPALPELIPWLLKSASADPSTVVPENNEGDDDEEVTSGGGGGGDGSGGGGGGNDDIEIDEINVGSVRLRVRTAELEEKTSAVAALRTLFKVLKPSVEGGGGGGGVGGHILSSAAPATLNVLIPILRTEHFTGFDELRAEAARAIPDVFMSLAAGTAINAAGDLQGYAGGLASALDALASAAAESDAPDMVSTYLEHFSELLLGGTSRASFLGGTPMPAVPCRGGPSRSFSLFCPLLTEASMNLLTRSILIAFNHSIQRRAVRAAEAKINDGEVDAEVKEAAESAEEEDALVGLKASEAWGALFKTHAGAYAATFNALVGDEMLAWGKEGRDPADARLLLYLGCDLLEWAGDDARNSAGIPWAVCLVPIFADAVRSPRDDMRQAAAFGLGVAAEASGYTGAFGQLADGAAMALLGVLRGYKPEGAAPLDTAHDNVVSALVRVARWALPAGTPRRREALTAALSRSPLTEDLDEAPAFARSLAALLLEGDGDAFADNTGAPDVTRIVATLRAFAVAVRRSKPRVFKDAVIGEVAAALAALQSRLTNVMASSVWSALESKDRETLTLQLTTLD